MRREYLPLQSLSAWARLNGIITNGVAFQNMSSTESDTDKGNAIVATEEISSHESDSLPQVLLQVPQDLVLSLETVQDYSKSDQDFREVLEACGGFGRTTRGAIMLFLLVQITHSSPDTKRQVGMSSPWSEYIKFFPPAFPLPTCYSDEEQQLLKGTSLAAVVEAKLSSLEFEFARLRQCTENISWCREVWWEEGTGSLTHDDWKYVDAAYRSRMVDLPGSGHAMVPCVDMANHVSGSDVRALYDADSEGNAILQLRWGKTMRPGEEVTISYGDEKPASEMIFSYGFLESDRAEENQVLLDMHAPDDDPLEFAKNFMCSETPGIRLSLVSDAESSSHVSWDSPLVWLACVNEEDGLHIKQNQTHDGAAELETTWKEETLTSPHHLREFLAADPSWDIFQLRAVVLLLEKLETQLAHARKIDEVLENMNEAMLQTLFRPEIFSLISQLRKVEGALLEKAVLDLEKQKTELMNSETVLNYLSQQSQTEEVEDFS
ncbi:hypothetical protein N7533_009680 [Penicillium manginii]|uniref:uncharacterized protein n=1 Tax=Penicillium manginii TaxID=203109 RepID=UPI0025487118|nr:uncharacterized protein N7533_009680 [Penicillium manginii]KAJ5744810.1 hypothetical protein N7533_009680 [Penicillium manginii]